MSSHAGTMCITCPECGTKIPDPEKNLWRSYLRKLEGALRKLRMWESLMGKLSFYDYTQSRAKGPAARRTDVPL